MKAILLIAVAASSSMAMALSEGKPFVLDAGKYTTECWSSTVQTVDGVKQRFDGYDVGTATVVDNGAINVETDEYTSLDGSVTNSTNTVRFTETSPGVFTINMDVVTKFTVDGKAMEDSHSYETSTKVEGNKSYNLVVKTDNGTPHPGVGEAMWRKMADGRIFNQSYIREKIQRTGADGKVTEILVSNSSCLYTPKN
jgi:hypothetical protein